MIKNICIVCKKEIGEQERCCLTREFKSICMGCEFKNVDVWRVSPIGDIGNSYHDTDITHIVDMLTECDYGDGYTVVKSNMRALKYHTLPEFTGF